jgi:tripartite-type tricarboxylate transporter receptor subunit TctC
MKRMRFAGALVATVALAASAVAAFADSYPSHPITFYVGFPPGGPTDTLSRILADSMQKTLGQPVVIETVSGASGTIAAGRVAHAAPDGYTIGIGNWSSHVGSPAIYALDFDVFKDLTPVSLLTTAPMMILGRNGLPPANAAELVSWVRARREPTTFGTVGVGSAGQLCGVFFEEKVGARLQFVPYRGAAPAMQDLIGGQIELACLEASSSLANVEAGRYRAYAVLSEGRWPKLSETPTMIESGVPGLTISFWHGLWAPAGTPKDIVDRLDGAVKTALADPTVRTRIENVGQVIFPAEQQNPAALAAFHKAETDKWWPVFKTAGIKAE